MNINNDFDIKSTNNNSDINFEDIRNLPFIKMLDDNESLDKIEEYANNLKFEIKSIVVIGIGGSILGIQAIVDSLYYSKSKSQRKVNVYFLDNIDPNQIYTTYNNLDPKSTLFVVQSKSGKTPEILAHYFYLIEWINQNELDLNKHLVFVTDPENGFLKEEAINKNITTFDIPPEVGGRYSVLSPVGLFVSRLLGLDIKSLTDGGKNLALDDSKLTSISNLADTIYQNYLNNKNILVIMPYSSYLNDFCNWSIQLISESLGKIDTSKNHVGITPLASKGATDQHSKLQLFQEGPDDKSYIFIKVKNHQKVEIKNVNNEFSYLNNVDFGKLLNIELLATQTSLFESERYSNLIEIDQIDENSIGELFVTFEILTHFIGLKLKVNIYDQPGVERSKILTKELLTKEQS
jgi:glucose-6-phosphate isomerase